LGANGWAVKGAVDPAIDVDRIGSQVECRSGVVIEGFQAIKHLPFVGGDTVARFTSRDGSKLERAMQEDRLMGQINPLSKCNKVFTSGNVLRDVRRAKKVRVSSVQRGRDVARHMILQPKTLISTVVSAVGSMHTILPK
jgi:hypothetical protein